MTASPAVTDIVEAARALTPLIRDHADETERERRLAAPVVAALRSAGLLVMGLPATLGGLETPVPTAFRAIEQLSYADGSTGWNAMIAFDSGLFGGLLTAPGARALIASLPRPVLAGSLAGNGRAVRTATGYQVTGRWRFASGCQHADVFGGMCPVYAGDQPVLGADGQPEQVLLFLRPGDVTILDTWHVGGLRGTGSHDFTVQDAIVAEACAQPAGTLFGAPVEPGPLYAFPLIAALGGAKAAVALGIARHALEALKELAQQKTPTGQTSLLRERGAVQADVARAEALVRAGRAFLHAICEEVWQAVAAGGEPTAEQHALLRLAGVDGVQRAVQAVDLMYSAGGATAIYETSPLERCFRDVHAVPAHLLAQPAVYESAGRVLLGLPPGTHFW